MATKDATSLGLREMILGVLKSKVVGGRSLIHSSDFRSTITELGFAMGSPIIEDILVHCKLDSQGNLDFAELERQLARERKVFNASKKMPSTHLDASSAAAPTKPWRADLAHHAKVEAERQLVRLQESNEEVRGIYACLSFHEISAQEALDRLSELGLKISQPFSKLVHQMEMIDVSFSEFVRVLTAAETEQLAGQNVSAGGFSIRNEQQADDVIGYRRKRADNLSRQTAFYESALKDDTQKTARKMRESHKDSSADRRIFKHTAVKDTLNEIKNTRDPTAMESMALLSHAQADMARGRQGVDSASSLVFSVD
eukprot:gene33981-41123_t